MIFSPQYRLVRKEVVLLDPNQKTFLKAQKLLLVTSLLLRASRSGEPMSLTLDDFDGVSILFILYFNHLVLQNIHYLPNTQIQYFICHAP